MNVSILSAIAQATTDSMLSGLGVGIVAIVQYHQLSIAKHDLDGIVIGTRIGQTDLV